MTKYKGKLIVLEGNDATGKDTHQAFIEDYFKQRGIPLVATRTIGGPPSSEAIRKVLLDTTIGELHQTTELLLFFAGRLENLQQHVWPALEAGSWVLSNRFSYSTIAYQGLGRGLGVKPILDLIEMTHPGFWPDLTFLFDQSAKTTVQRLNAQGGHDRIELSKPEFFETVRQAYLDMLPDAADNEWNTRLKSLDGYSQTQFEVLDSERTIADIQIDIQDRLDQYIQQAEAA